MKLRSLTFENVNSLAGTWKIDFTDPAYQSGVFLITGRTGAGKTSIFDAVTLALYGQTMRQRFEELPDDAEECPYMTRGTRYCRAEAEFESGGRRWRSCYRVIKSAANGKLAREGSLYVQDEPNGNWRESVSEFGAWKQTMREVLGMQFQEFLRTVTVETARFMRFMNSPESERASVLESITGTGLYKKISSAVWEETKKREKALQACEARLAGIQLLSAGELKADRDRLADLSQEEASLRKDLDRYEDLIGWLNKRNALEREEEAARNELASAEAADERFAENRARLEDARAARNYEPQLSALSRYEEMLDELKRRQKSLQDEAKARNVTLNEFSSREEAGDEAVRAAYAEIDALEALFVRVSELDLEIVRVRERRDFAEDALRQAGEAKNGLEETLDRMESAARKADSELDALNAAADKTARDRDIAEVLPGLRERAARLLRLEEYLGTFRENLRQAKQRENEAVAAVREAERKLQTEEQAMKTASERVSQAKARCAEVKGGLEPVDRMKELSAVNEKISLYREMTAAKKELDRVTQLEEKARGRLSETERMSRERDQRSQQAKKSGIEMAVSYARLAGEKAEQFRALKNDQIPQLVASRATRSAALRQLEFRDQTFTKRMNAEGSRLLPALEAERETLMRWARQYEAAEKSLSEAENRMNEACASRLAALGVLNEKKVLQAAAAANAAAAETSLKNLSAECGSVEEAWHDALRPFGFGETALSPEEILQRLEDRKKIRANVLSERAEKQSGAAVGRAVREQVSEMLRRAETSESECRGSLDKVSAELSERLSERESLFGHRVVSEERKAARAKLNKVKSQQNTLQTQITEARRAFHKAEALAEQCSLQIDAAEQDKKTAETNLDIAIHAYFSSMDEFLRARKDPEIIAGWEKEDGELLAALKAGELRLSLVKRALQEHLVRGDVKEDLGSVEEKQRLAEASYIGVVRESTMLQTEMKMNDARRVEAEEARRLEANARSEFERWNELNVRIGSEDGNRFAGYAQGLSFRRLLHFANEELLRLTGRYALEPASGSSLDFRIVDNARNCLSRPSSNLSAGETFLVSLAMALGLTRMSGDAVSEEKRPEFLIFDEGFGTLDQGMLENALRALSILREEGRVIGVISQIEALKQTIPVQLRVQASAVNGRNGITGPGVRA